MHNLSLGLRGEESAVDFLKKKGFKILERNFRTNFGQIDIIAKEKNEICFIEVKTRKNFNFGLPQEAVSITKKKRIAKVALAYLKEKRLLNKKVRFDVVSILWDGNIPKIELIRDAFEVEEAYA
ncbi:MAG: YraN family protein [Candidatus Omnitrophica bacterium]|nr:YraN family protein [Candidatus Omnitrophota bacterium]